MTLKRPSLARRLVRYVAILAMAAPLGVAALLMVLWLEHRGELTLSKPTGPFPIARTTYAWVNQALTDELAPSPGSKREVLVWIWYPSANTLSATPMDYQPAPWRIARAGTSGLLMSQFLTRDSAMVRAHSSGDPTLSPVQSSYPVVIMRAGGGALTTDFTTLAEDLASHGYVVVGFDAPYRTGVVVFPDGRVVVRPRTADPEGLSADQQERLIDKLLPMWSSDVRFVVDQLERLNRADPAGHLTGHLDTQRLGIFGHSFGGATALQFCHDDARCKAGIDIDGAPHGTVVAESLTQPFLFLLSDHGDLHTPEASAIFHDIHSIYDRLPKGSLLLSIRGANHFSFSDQILLKSRLVVRLLQFLQGGLEARRGLAITTSYVHTFFDVHLKSGPSTLFDTLRQVYPEVQPIPAQ